MMELKLVKHALKKILRMSRQLILENEYYSFFDLVPMNDLKPSIETLTDSIEEERVTPFLHQKHLQRNFLIFKEVTYSIRDKSNETIQDEEVDNE